MIVPRVDNHVGGGWHVTGDASGARAPDFVVMVSHAVILARQVTGSAKVCSLEREASSCAGCASRCN